MMNNLINFIFEEPVYIAIAVIVVYAIITRIAIWLETSY